MSKNKPNTDQWVKCIARNGNLHATAINAPLLINEARIRHKLNITETKALGETLLAALLLSSTCRQGERISLSLKGDKQLQQAVADSDTTGAVRGFILTRKDYSDPDPQLGPWQNGLLSVVRLKTGEKEPYTGTVPIVTGHLPKDLTFYLSQSEQVPSSVGIAVNVDDKGIVTSAGGFLVQVMPGASKAEILVLENNIHEMQKIAEQVAEHAEPNFLLAQVFGDLGFTILSEKDVRFECTCSKERVSMAIQLLGKAEIEDMIDKDKGANVNCDFCGEAYRFTKKDLEDLIS